MIIKYGRKTITWFSMVTLMSMVFVEMIGVLFPVFELQASGTAEITSYLGALTIAFCIFFATMENTNVRVLFLVEKLPESIRVYIDATGHFFSGIALLLLLWPGFVYAFSSLEEGEISTLLRIPIFPFRFVFVFALSLALVVVLIRLIKSILKIILQVLRQLSAKGVTK